MSRMFGIIPLNKPVGWTSRAAVDRVQRLVRPARAGHAGTLDPVAEGVLVVCVGPATRLIEYIQQAPKEYTATFLLGRHSPSDDTETEVTIVQDAPVPTRDAAAAALPRFEGVIQQRPPAYSAVKIAGQRAYRLARRGEAVDTTPRSVEVFSLAIQQYDYPELTLAIRASGGTYVRSLGRDIAGALGTTAIMARLVRTAVGDFHIEHAADPRELRPDNLASFMLPPVKAVERLPRIIVSGEQLELVRNGGLLRVECASPVAAIDNDGNLVAILKEARPGLARPSPNFLQME